MRSLIALILGHKWYFIGFVFILFLALIPQLLLNQGELFLRINSLHSNTLDALFYWLTYFGDGLMFIAIIVVLLFISYSKALIGLSIFLSTSLFAQVLKRVFFADHFRPYKVMGAQHELYIPDGVTPIVYESFPSGHTVTAFALAIFLVLTYPLRKWSGLLLVMAWLVAYSRVYLTHHFPIDVWVGSVIGTLGGLLIYWLVADNLHKRFDQQSFLNK